MSLTFDARLPAARAVVRAGVLPGDVIEGLVPPGHHNEAPVRLRLIACGDQLCLWRVATLSVSSTGTPVWRDDGESCGWSLHTRLWSKVADGHRQEHRYDLPVAPPPPVDGQVLLSDLRDLADPLIDVTTAEADAYLGRMVELLSRRDHDLRSWAIHACQAFTAGMSHRARLIWEATNADLPIGIQLDAVLRGVLIDRAAILADQCAVQGLERHATDHQDACATVNDLPPVHVAPAYAERSATARPDAGDSLAPQTWTASAAQPVSPDADPTLGPPAHEGWRHTEAGTDQDPPQDPPTVT
jgi:hypothetical protein